MTFQIRQAVFFYFLQLKTEDAAERDIKQWMLLKIFLTSVSRSNPEPTKQRLSSQLQHTSDHRALIRDKNVDDRFWFHRS